jgi:hypothetical protein
VSQALHQATGVIGSLKLKDVAASVMLPPHKALVCMPQLELRTTHPTKLTAIITENYLRATLNPPVRLEVVLVEVPLLVYGLTWNFKTQRLDLDIRGGKMAENIKLFGGTILHTRMFDAMSKTRMQSKKYNLHSDPDPVETML